MQTTNLRTRTPDRQPEPTRRWRLVGPALLALALAAGACSSSATEQAEEETATTTSVERTTSTEAEAEAPASEDEAVEDEQSEGEDAEAATGPATFDAAAPLFTEQFSTLPTGTHRFDNLGTEFSVTTDANLVVQPNVPGQVVVTSPSSRGPGFSDVIFMRLSSFFDPADPGNPDGEGWDASDLDGWIAAADPGLLISDRQEVTIGDLPAQRFDIELADDYRCGDEFCANFLTNRAELIWLDPGHSYRVWHIPQGDEQPIVVVAGAGPSGASWLDDATAFMDSVAFGPVLPSPVPADGNLWELGFPTDVPAGTVTLPIGPGVTFELDEGTFIWQRSNFAAVTVDAPAENDLVLVTATLDGPVSTAAEVLTFLTERTNFDITETTEVETAGTTATRLTFEGRQTPLLYSGEDVEFETWTPPIYGVLWLLDSEAGPLMITAESFADEATLDLVLPRAERMIETLELG